MSLSGADSRKEVFEVCNERNEVVGTELRSVVHREGLFHRAVNVLLFNGGGDLLLQRRAADKDVCPGRWDLSVGEHLKVGETYEGAARRGLFEELGIAAARVERVREAHLHSYDFDDAGVKDREFNELWQARHEGDIRCDGVEVVATRFVAIGEAVAEMERDPAAFTPWCHEEVRAYMQLLRDGSVELP